jgi:hypothetical protein
LPVLITFAIFYILEIIVSVLIVRNVNNYEKLNRVGEGTYGVVSKNYFFMRLYQNIYFTNNPNGWALAT